jgi:hypothetical protein
VSENDVRLQLGQEDAAELLRDRDVGEIIHENVSRSLLVAQGLDIELQQYVKPSLMLHLY